MRFIFIPAAFLFYSGICAYIGARLLGFAGYFFPAISPAVYWVVYAALCFALVFFSFAGGKLFILRAAGSVWLAVFFYMFTLLAASDFIRLLLFISGRQTDNFRLYSTGASVVLCVVLIIAGMINARTIRTASYDVSLSGGGSNVKIALISDIHIGSVVDGKWVRKIVGAINVAEPDVVCIAGDIFDGNIDSVRDLQAVVDALAGIKAPLGAYACLGNHDADRMFGGGTDRIESILKSAGVTLLRDEVYEIRDNLFIAGRKDARPIGAEADRKSARELLAGLDGNVIVLDHQPVDFTRIESAGAALVLCGHTHKGQVFPATLLTREIFKRAGAVYYGYLKGQPRVSPSDGAPMQAVVTSGAGVWGPPLRIGTNSEVVIVNVNFVL
jgi:predicted MPP superfamily phosphohydrolase